LGKLLIVDDDLAAAMELKEAMQPHGWLVEVCGAGFDALQLLQNFKYDFILLDWNLPDLSGPEICQKFRDAGGMTPIIFLTGRHGIANIEEALDSGGDDYLTKPFDVRELLARIRTIKRRPQQVTSGKLRLRDLQFDPMLRVLSNGAEQVQLSPTENAMLEALCRSPNTYFPSAALFKAVWPSETESSDEIVRTHMKVLRRKIKLLTSVELISTQRGSGYVINADDVKFE
jgi:DNA-binding response OmpR family regulator